MDMYEQMKRYGFKDENGLDLMKCTQFQAMLRVWQTAESISNGSPPDDWESESWCGYAGYGSRGESDFVDEVDDGNMDDIHSHGTSVGMWYAAKRLRDAMWGAE